MIVWLTGQPGSGKTTVAKALRASGLIDDIVDGDDLRALSNPGYDEAGRRTNIDRAQAIAAYLNAQGRDVAVSLVAPYRDQREAFKAAHPVVEVYLHTSEVRGREHFFVDDYELPLEDFVDIDTGEAGISATVRSVYRAMAHFSQRASVVGGEPTEAGESGLGDGKADRRATASLRTD